MAYFLNQYMNLGHAERDIYFRGVWHLKKGKGAGTVLSTLEKSKNGPFRALYWISKDLFHEAFADVADPEAKALHELRINLEHRYVKVHQAFLGEPGRQPPSDDPFVDTLAYSISRFDLERRTLRLLKLVRAALIYLSLGMYREEHRRERLRRSKRLRFGQPLQPMPDAWKR